MSDAQKKKVEEKIDEIMQVAIPWQTRYERIQDGTLSQDEPCNDAASELVKATGAKIYKIKSGEFKTYFAINTNCVKLADYITGSAGLDVCLLYTSLELQIINLYLTVSMLFQKVQIQKPFLIFSWNVPTATLFSALV